MYCRSAEGSPHSDARHPVLVIQCFRSFSKAGIANDLLPSPKGYVGMADEAGIPNPISYLTVIIVPGSVVFIPAALLTVSRTVYDPGLMNGCFGFFSDATVVLNHCPSPKLQFHVVG